MLYLYASSHRQENWIKVQTFLGTVIPNVFGEIVPVISSYILLPVIKLDRPCLDVEPVYTYVSSRVCRVGGGGNSFDFLTVKIILSTVTISVKVKF